MIALSRIGDYPNGHGGADDTGHGADRAVVMACLEDNLAAGSKRLRFDQILGPSFVEDRADNRPFHRATHVVPRDGRTTMEDHALLHVGTYLTRDTHSVKHWLGR